MINVKAIKRGSCKKLAPARARDINWGCDLWAHWRPGTSSLSYSKGGWHSIGEEEDEHGCAFFLWSFFFLNSVIYLSSQPTQWVTLKCLGRKGRRKREWQRGEREREWQWGKNRSEEMRENWHRRQGSEREVRERRRRRKYYKEDRREEEREGRRAIEEEEWTLWGRTVCSVTATAPF